jgi:ABC-type Fe3+-hydroxamate transport system substrate-binding protein
MRATIHRRAFLVLPLAAASPGRAHAAMQPITDALGRTVTLKAPAERIVVGFNFEEFTAVAGPAGWDGVVGFDRHQWENNRRASWIRYQAAIPRLSALADIGDTETDTFSVERVLGLKPDLLITLAAGYTSCAPLMAQVEQAGQLGDIQLRVEGRPRPKAYVELGNTYNNAMGGRMVEFAGGANIATGRIPTGWAPMSAEYVLAAAPAHIFITGSSWTNAPNAVRAGYDYDIETTRCTLAPYAGRPGWSALPAIRVNELHAIEAGLARSLWDWTGTQYIAKQLHPDAFADVDPVKSLRRYHEQFLPVTFEGCWMARVTPALA